MTRRKEYFVNVFFTVADFLIVAERNGLKVTEAEARRLLKNWEDRIANTLFNEGVNFMDYIVEMEKRFPSNPKTAV